MFCVMVIFGVLFNPMNALAFSFSDLYLSLTLFYGALLMASNMIWAHEIVRYLTHKKIDLFVLFLGIFLSFVMVLILRTQLFVDDKQWLRRMISHHSTALTTTNKIILKTKNDDIRRLAKDIIETQEKEIKLMNKLL